MKHYKSRENGRKTKAYTTWHNMVARCGVHPAYWDCKVTTKWLDFQEFAAWYYAQSNVDKEGFTLDKDILVKGNKLYSPETCSLVPVEINRLVSTGTTGSGSVLPVGVVSTPQGYRSRLRYKGKDTLGEPSGCPQVAHKDYLKVKSLHVRSVALEYSEVLDEDVKVALSLWEL